MTRYRTPGDPDRILTGELKVHEVLFVLRTGPCLFDHLGHSHYDARGSLRPQDPYPAPGLVSAGLPRYPRSPVASHEVSEYICLSTSHAALMIFDLERVY
jgi:hypothetical protein